MQLQFSLPSERQPIPDHAQKVFTGEIFSIYQWEQQLFDGSVTVFEKLKRDDTVGVVAVTGKDKIVITEQEQPGMSPFYSLAGGRLDPGETVAEAALRELREETGMQAATLKPWFAIQPVEKIEWTIYTVIASKCTKVSDLALDPGEKIKLHEVSFNEFVALSRDPRFRDKEISSYLYQAEVEARLDEVAELFFG